MMSWYMVMRHVKGDLECIPRFYNIIFQKIKMIDTNDYITTLKLAFFFGLH